MKGRGGDSFFLSFFLVESTSSFFFLFLLLLLLSPIFYFSLSLLCFLCMIYMATCTIRCTPNFYFCTDVFLILPSLLFSLTHFLLPGWRAWLSPRPRWRPIRQRQTRRLAVDPGSRRRERRESEATRSRASQSDRAQHVEMHRQRKRQAISSPSPSLLLSFFSLFFSVFIVSLFQSYSSRCFSFLFLSLSFTLTLSFLIFQFSLLSHRSLIVCASDVLDPFTEENINKKMMLEVQLPSLPRRLSLHLSFFLVLLFPNLPVPISPLL